MLLARMAERMFWMGRYLERAEDLARALLVYEQVRLDIPGRDELAWQKLARLAGIDAGAAARLDAAALVGRMVRDRENPSSLLGAVHRARENLRQARSLLPSECWHTLNLLYLRLESFGEEAPPAALASVLAYTVASCQELSGRIAGCMLRDQAHTFLRLGVRLERADMLLRITTTVADALIPADHPFGFEDVRWMALLRSVGAYHASRRRHHARSDFGNALDLLLLEPAFPRSLMHTVMEIDRELAGLPHSEEPHAALRACWPVRVEKSRAGLERFAPEALRDLARLGAVIESTYFHLAPERTALAPAPAPTQATGR
jgi:uncharacterized alpha-E superfamily protein